MEKAEPQVESTQKLLAAAEAEKLRLHKEIESLNAKIASTASQANLTAYVAFVHPPR